MGHDELVTKVDNNTQHITDVRNAFEKLKGNVLFILAVCSALFTLGGILWYLAMFVFNTKTGTTNNHNDIVTQTAEFHKEIIELRSHIDAKLKDQSDTINSIKHNQAVNQASYIKNFNTINYHLVQHDFALKVINQKCDYYIKGWVTEHKNTPTSNPTFQH